MPRQSIILLLFCLSQMALAQEDLDVFASVDLPYIAYFPGGHLGFAEEAAARLVYPKAALEVGLEGRVLLELEISVEGKIDSIHIRQSLSPECDEEAIRCVKGFQDQVIFEPGKIDGAAQPMSWYFTLVFNHRSKIVKAEPSVQPVYNYALFNKATRLYEAKRYRRAYKYFDRYVHAFPEDEDGYLYRGKAAEKLEQGRGCSDFRMASALGSSEAGQLAQRCE